MRRTEKRWMRTCDGYIRERGNKPNPIFKDDYELVTVTYDEPEWEEVEVVLWRTFKDGIPFSVESDDERVEVLKKNRPDLEFVKLTGIRRYRKPEPKLETEVVSSCGITHVEKEAEEYLLREQLEEWKKRAMSYKSLAAARQEKIERLYADLVIQLERSQRMVSRVDYDADVSRRVAEKDAEIERLKKAVERAVEVLSLRTCYKDCPNNPKCAVLTMVSKGDCGDYWREWLMGEGK